MRLMRARDRRIALATVVTEGFLGRLAFGMVSFAFPLYALSLGLSLAQIGVLISLRAIAELLCKPVAGWLSDRRGIRTVYLFGAFGRVMGAAGLLIAGELVGLMVVRLLLGISGAGRDVASLGVIARDAETRVGTAYGWYSSAKHVGGIAGAGVAGLLLAAGGGFQPLFVTILVLSVLPMAAAWVGLREVSSAPSGDRIDGTPASRDLAARRRRPAHPPSRGWGVTVVIDVVQRPASALSRAPSESADRITRRIPAATGLAPVFQELSGPALVGLLVATSAQMVHGIFPILATEYAGLSEVQAGLIYSLSAAIFLVAGPACGWLVDRYGRVIGIAWRSAANVGSSLVYLASPSFAGLAAARSIDDSGKAAFRPAWASTISDLAAKDPSRRGQRLGALDASQNIGEALGPALAGFLWQSGGIFALFAIRILIAVAAEVAAIRTFGEFRRSERRSRADLAHAALSRVWS
jgi:MFS family permease